MKKLIPLVLFALLAGAVAAPALAHHKPKHKTPPGHAKGAKGAQSGTTVRPACTDAEHSAKEIALTVEGDTATGRYTFPAQAPDTLVVFAHGYSHHSESWVNHMLDAAAKHGVVSVAMDYRGTYEEKTAEGTVVRGWFVKEGAEDMVQATKHFLSLCPSIKKTVLFGVSMGGNASGLALAAAAEEKAPDGSPLFDYWFDVEGAVNVVETYAGASVLAPANEFAANAKEDIEDEMNATFKEDPEGYMDLAVVSHVDEIADSGVKGITVIHALEDGLVPYNQAREIVSLLIPHRIPLEVYTIGEKGEGESGTTLTGYSPFKDSPFAGHASEKSTTHLVMVTAFERLWKLVDRNVEIRPYSESFVSG